MNKTTFKSFLTETKDYLTDVPKGAQEILQSKVPMILHQANQAHIFHLLTMLKIMRTAIRSIMVPINPIFWVILWLNHDHQVTSREHIWLSYRLRWLLFSFLFLTNYYRLQRGFLKVFFIVWFWWHFILLF